MSPATEVQFVSDQFAVWQAYDPDARVECMSSAVRVHDAGGWAVVDPIPLSMDAVEDLAKIAPPIAVLCTSCNHERSCAAFAGQHNLPLFAPEEAIHEFGWANSQPLHEGEQPIPGVEPIALPGAAVGEMAIWFEHAAVMVVGDAIIHLNSTGLALLPPKYCTSQKLLKVSLQKLLRYPFQILSFAHGLPLVANPGKRLAALLT